MKLSNLLLIFALALICLFSLQAFWLYHTYQLRSRNIEESINSIFFQTIKRELDQRFLVLERNMVENLSDANMHIDTFEVDFNELRNKIINQSIVSQDFDMNQLLMTKYNIPFSIVTVDSIFSSLLHLNHYLFSYQINREDSTGRIIETTNPLIGKGYKTIVLPIVNGEKTYSVVKITLPAVFKNMLAILIVSILIFFLIIACLTYGIKMFLDQHHLIQLRDNFTYALTHDMKTPLAAIHSVLIQLEEKTLDENPDLRQKFFTIAIEQTLNLQTTVNQILTLAYVEKNQLLLNKQSIDLPAMIQSLIDKFTVKVDKAIAFQRSYNLANSIVYADPFYLNNAISNLIDNAIKFSGESVKIEIECTSGRRHIYIHVRDNGFGISSNDQLKIFKQFERGAEIKRNQISGFGIGLNYVQQVIEAHGGTVTVLSRERVGSEFVITLPH